MSGKSSISIKPSFMKALEANFDGREISDKIYFGSRAIIGSGRFGDVVRCDVKGEVKAVKSLDLNISNIELLELRRVIELYTKRFVHENIVVYSEIAVNNQEKVLYLIMDYMPHQSIQEFIKRNKANLVRRLAIDISQQLFSALTFIHGKGGTHGDLKSANVLLQPVISDGTLKVKLSLNVPRLVKPLESQNLNDSFSFLAPEVAKGMAPTLYSDIWSAGAILVHMLTSQVPYCERSKHGIISALKLDQLPTQMTLSACKPHKHIITALLRPDPMSRPMASTTLAMLQAISESLAGRRTASRRMVRMRHETISHPGLRSDDSRL